MEDGELDFSSHELFTGANMGDIPSSGSIDSFFDDIFKDTHACTHTHTCNPPGPDSSHTHTCYHVHTKIVPAMSGDDDKTPTDDTAESNEKKGKKRPLGNREAVRKYREKKKARAASLEDEVVRLRALNQQLMKRIQSQAGLEAEVARLKCLLVDIRGRIEGEIGSFPYQKQLPANHNIANPNMTGGYVMNPCNMQCGDQAYCLHPVVDGKTGEDASIHDPALNGCEFENLHCLGNQNPLLNELPGCGTEDGFPVANPSGGRTKRKGARSTISK
ncbi:basic leucine zipper 23-like [Cynara cardunculus var. scolymus]|uniref:basic leucine zipper 23-like n=1 Tax=Cynara cardunculus var. scolymus TaxID=59895 RepID=UPI000D6314CA|nr:basic leucine zipper 23-like [Cynara cardunculus var. scolymus]XP_024991228.1 basic leucine zipper 23-like [Cynara cardunculus var. scolymus]XP_024991229.1 basic leucine zipper 23-like [Cynara cardunculus var. scolymus]